MGGSSCGRQRSALGPLRGPERRVAVVFVVVALLWVTRPLLGRLVAGLSDAGIGVGGGVLLFLLPAGGGSGEALLDWEDARGLPWGVLLLFGGGLSLASAFQSSGLTEAIGGVARSLAGVPPLALVAVTAAIVILLTELTSNTATAAAFLPVLASVAVGGRAGADVAGRPGRGGGELRLHAAGGHAAQRHRLR